MRSRFSLTKAVSAATVLAVALVGLSSVPATAGLKGKSCSKVKSTKVSGGLTFVCTKVGKKKVWKLKQILGTNCSSQASKKTFNRSYYFCQATGDKLTWQLFSSDPNAIQLNNPVSYPTEVKAVIPTGGNITPPQLSNVPDSPGYLKLWIADPLDNSKYLKKSGIFYNPASEWNWKFLPMNADGSVYVQLSAGKYMVDVIETDATQQRKRYNFEITATGAVLTDDAIANSQGVYGVTVGVSPPASDAVKAKRQALLDLANQPASTFQPTSACQLLDQVTPQRGMSVGNSAGFPKVRVRLKSFGRIKALIVPVDFSDQVGQDDPVKYFTPVARDVRDFYFLQSYGQVALDFEIVPNWVRMKFLATKYGLGGTVGNGDPGSYLDALFAATDSVIDYSQYDAVYFLVPKEMPMSVMGWGPAFGGPHWVPNGYIVNGATGGADMYTTEANGIVGGRWKWMAHEMGHNFGLYDEDYKHQSSTLGYWNIMAMNWSNAAIEMGAWDRYLQGWLPESQVFCTLPGTLNATAKTFSLTPVVQQGAGMKAVLIPVTGSKMLVIESRKRTGLDLIAKQNQGVLVYTVDMTIGQLGGGYVTVRRTGSTDPNFEDAALKVGDTITVNGISITFTASTTAADTVSITKK